MSGFMSAAGLSDLMKDDDGDEVIYVQPHAQPAFVPSSDEEAMSLGCIWVLGCTVIPGLSSEGAGKTGQV